MRSGWAHALAPKGRREPKVTSDSTTVRCGAPKESASGFLLQESLCVQRRHAARASRGDGLAVHMVLHVAGSEHARHAGHRGKADLAGAGVDVAVLHLDLAL